MLAERRVYIVDDDEAVRDSLSVLLESKAFAVRSSGGCAVTSCWVPDCRHPHARDGRAGTSAAPDRSLT